MVKVTGGGGGAGVYAGAHPGQVTVQTHLNTHLKAVSSMQLPNSFDNEERKKQKKHRLGFHCTTTMLTVLQLHLA